MRSKLTLILLLLPAACQPDGGDDPESSSSPVVSATDKQAPANSFIPLGDLANFCPPGGTFGKGDFDGDGKTDFYCHTFGTGRTQVALTRITGGTLSFLVYNNTLGAWCTAGRIGAAQLDGTSGTELFCHDPVNAALRIARPVSGASNFSISFNSVGWCGNPLSGTAQLHVGDVDGNGRPDLLCVSQLPSGQTTVSTRLGTGTTFNPGFGGTLCTTSSARQTGTADFNGDGVADLYCHDLSSGNTWVTTSARTSLSSARLWLGGWCGGSAPFGVGDFDGNGRSDVWCKTSAGNVAVALSAGTSFNDTGAWTGSFCAKPGDSLLSERGATAPADLDDFNGDGKTDVACYSPTTGEISIGLAAPARGAFVDTTKWTANFCPMGSAVVTGKFLDDRRAFACRDPNTPNGTVHVAQSAWQSIPYGGGHVFVQPKLHLIFYGEWNPFSQGVSRIIQFVQDLSGSAWYNTMTTYHGTDLRPVSPRLAYTGVDFDYYSIGSTLGYRGIDIINANIPAAQQDENTVYTIVFSNDVTGWGYCPHKCAQHMSDVNPVTGKRLTWSQVGIGCPSCELPEAPGPDAQIEGVLSIIAHELVESISDPWGQGWIREPETENADICAFSFGAVTDAGSGKRYNLAVGPNRYLLQQNWAAIDDSTGYCTAAYPYAPLDFSNTSIQLATGASDWKPGSYKAECARGAAIAGLSSYTANQKAHSALCRTEDESRFTRNGCTVRDFSAFDNRGTTATGDWDLGYFKGECRANEYVAGVSQTTGLATNAILCCPGAVTHASCRAIADAGGDARELWESGDWDPQFYKMECGRGRYVAGVSRNTATGAPHSILCCGY